MSRAPLARPVAAATLVAAATCVLGPTAPAAAAPCSSGSGVTMVVDPGALGGALVSACDSGSGQAASGRYADVGVALTYVQRQPGFVCRVNGAPASDPCVNTPPADAYWGLWWTDGESGTWTFSSIGVTGLQVPQGGAVALAWQQGSARRAPGTAAPVHAASPSPSPSPAPSLSPSTSPTRAPTPKPTPKPPTPSAPATASVAPVPGGRPSANASSSAVPTRSPSPQTTDEPAGRTAAEPVSKPARTPSLPPDERASASPEAIEAAPGPAPAADVSPAEQQRVPTWLTLTVLALLLVAIAGMALAARRGRSDPS